MRSALVGVDTEKHSKILRLFVCDQVATKILLNDFGAACVKGMFVHTTVIVLTRLINLIYVMNDLHMHG